MPASRRDGPARLQAVLETVNDPLITIDGSGTVVDWNPAASERFGWSSKEAVGRPLAELILPAASVAAFGRLLDATARDEREGAEDRRARLVAFRRDGAQIPVELHAVRVRAGRQVVFGIRAVAPQRAGDGGPEPRTGGRILAADKLQEAATLSWTADSFEDALRRCLSILCEVADWPVGHVWLPTRSQEALFSTDIWHVTDGRPLPPLARLRADLRITRGRGFVGRIWATGEPLWVKDVSTDPAFVLGAEKRDPGVKGAFGFPVFVDREIAAVVELFSDDEAEPDPQLLLLVGSLGSQLGRIIERRRWDEEQARLAAIVDSSNDAIIGRALDGTITSWNLGAEEIYGYAAEEALGRTVDVLILPPDRGHEEPEIREALGAGRRLREFETVRRRKDGRLVAVSISASPIVDSRGRTVGTATIERDITLRRQRETELEQARDAAEGSNRAKDEFLANISHELRTPMNAILGMIELSLGEPGLPSDVRANLETAQDSARILRSLVDDLLDFSRAEVGRFELDAEPFGIRRAIDDAMRALSLRAHERGLELACHVHRDVPERVAGDARRLRQIVTNLAGNAIKFTEQGEVVVRVAVESSTAEDVTLGLSVTDTGIGIDPADHGRIFEPFTQVDASTTRRRSGTGLGLAICRELVEKMGGRIGLDSALGRGSTFRCTLRFRRLRSELADGAPQAGERLKSVRVLVVDDNATNRRILEETLRNWSMQPVTAESGHAALELVRSAAAGREPFPVMLVDGLMPDMDGITFIETLQRESLAEGEIILMMSSVDRRTFQDRCDELPVAAFLDKPVSQSMLFDALATALGGPQGEDRSVEGNAPAPGALTILVVEDTPANQKVVRAVLERRGHFVELAGNGREAVELCRRTPFDVVLMDVQMPTMDGLQATAAIRGFAEGGDVPIVAMTAHAMRSDRERCLRAGMNAYLPKPIDAAELVRIVERFGARRDRAPAPTASQPAAPPAPVPPSASPPAPSRPVANGATHGPVDAPPLDLRAARARIGGDENLLSDMAGFFAEDVPELQARLRAALDSCNAESAARAAHSLKGLASNFDAHAAVAAARHVEQAAGDGRLVDAAEGLAAIEREFERVAEELRRAVPR